MSNKKYTMKNGKAVKVSEEIYKYLVKSYRRIRYIEEDLKRNTYIIDSVNEKVTVIPKREQSLDKLMEIGMDFSDGMMDFQDNAILKIALEQATDTEMMLTIMSCFAQAESESISKNVSWGIRQSLPVRVGI